MGRAHTAVAQLSGVGSRIVPAPNPAGVVWENVDMSRNKRATRIMLVTAATTALIILWVVPMAFIASLTTLEALDLWLKGLDVLEGTGAHVPIVAGFVQGVIPALLISIFMSVLPLVMAYFSRLEGYISKSEIGFATLHKMFLFQVINVFLVSLVAGSALATVEELAHDVGGTLEAIGAAIPRTGTFFTTLVLLRGTTGDAQDGREKEGRVVAIALVVAIISALTLR